MSRFTKWAIIPAIALALVLTTDASKADAGGFSINIGSSGFGYGNSGYGYGYGTSGYRYGGYGGYGYNSHRFYGPTVYPGVSTRYGVGYRGYVRPHVNYRAPVVVPRGRHFHYRSGRFGMPYLRH
jgi:hypothetical protein